MSTLTLGDWGTGAPSGSATTYGWSARGTGAIPLAPVPATDVAAMTADQIMPLLHGLQPGAVTDAGLAHLRLGQNLAATADKLAAHGRTLSENWTGQSADVALAKLEQVHAQTVTMAQAATQAGDVLTWLGQSVLPSFKELPDPRGGLLNAGGSLVSGLEHAADFLSGSASTTAAAVATSAADTAARNYLTALNGYLAEASDNLPTSTGSPAFLGSLQPATGASGTAAGGGHGVIGGFSPGGGLAAGSAGSAGSPTPAVSGTGAGRTGPSAGTPSAGVAPGSSSLPASLQGVPASPGSATSVSPVMPGGSSGAGGIGSGAGTTASLPTGATSVPGLGVPGVDPDPALPDAAGGFGAADAPGYGPAADAYANGGGPVSAAGAAGAQGGASGTPAAEADGTAATGADGAAGADGAGFPMMGAGAGGQQEKERQRQAWMYEEEDIWGGPTGCVPAVIDGTDWTWKKNQN